MNRLPIKSNNLKSVGWQGDTLEIEFVSGAIWQYRGVPREKYEALTFAKSAGRYFQAEIRSKYPGNKIRGIEH